MQVVTPCMIRDRLNNGCLLTGIYSSVSIAMVNIFSGFLPRTTSSHSIALCVVMCGDAHYMGNVSDCPVSMYGEHGRYLIVRRRTASTVPLLVPVLRLCSSLSVNFLVEFDFVVIC